MLEFIDFLFEKKTKWIPLHEYNHDGTDYIILMRRGVKSGMIYFKVKVVSPKFAQSFFFKGDIFNTKDQFDKILSEN